MDTIKQTAEHSPRLYTALKNTYTILGCLLNSAALDMSTEAKDCLEVFDQYDWLMAEGCDATRFLALKDKGNAGTMVKEELDEFIGMVSDDGEVHLYFFIARGHAAVAEYNDIVGASSISLAPPE